MWRPPTLWEGQFLTGETTVGNVLRALHGMGPRVVALTRDKDGCVISMDGQVAVAEGIDVEAVDPTGAGDTLAAALCVGLQEGHAARAAGGVLQQRGHAGHHAAGGHRAWRCPPARRWRRWPPRRACRVTCLPLDSMP